jgi:hypothetical protein
LFKRGQLGAVGSTDGRSVCICKLGIINVKDFAAHLRSSDSPYVGGFGCLGGRRRVGFQCAYCEQSEVNESIVPKNKHDH